MKFKVILFCLIITLIGGGAVSCTHNTKDAPPPVTEVKIMTFATDSGTTICGYALSNNKVVEKSDISCPRIQ